MSDIALQMQRTTGGLVGTAENVIFDSLAFSAGNIGYNAATGVITFNEAARYVVCWWVSTQAAASHTGASWVLSASPGASVMGHSFKMSGEMAGVAIVNVTRVPVTVSLQNDSGNIVYFSSISPVTATLAVLNDSPSQPLAAYGSLYSDSIQALPITAGNDTLIALPEVMQLKNVTPGSDGLIIDAAGDYWIEFMVLMQSTAGNVGIDAGVQANGSYIDALIVSTVLSSDFSTLTASSIVPCSAGDVLNIALTGAFDASVLLGPRVNAVLSVMRLGE